MTDDFDLGRFVAAQADIYNQALDEIRRGAKRSHWMWFIFPQIGGLGHSAMAHRYAIHSLAEAQAYLADDLLGPRLHRCVEALDESGACSAQAVFGAIDAMKLRSSLTLFEAAGGGPIFAGALDRWFGGERDGATLRLLALQ